MKTNHRRNYRDTRRPSKFAPHAITRVSALADKSVVGFSGCCCYHGPHGYAIARRGAKKYVRTRLRFHENQALKKLVKEVE